MRRRLFMVAMLGALVAGRADVWAQDPPAAAKEKNPMVVLTTSLGELIEKPYDAGWLYEFTGEPDDRALDVDGYRALLDATIDRMLEKQQQQESKNE